MSIVQEAALDAACNFLQESHCIHECLQAIRWGQVAIRFDLFDLEKTDVHEHLTKVAGEADKLSALLELAGLTSLAEYLYRIGRRIEAVIARGRTDAVAARIDINNLKLFANEILERIPVESAGP